MELYWNGNMVLFFFFFLLFCWLFDGSSNGSFKTQIPLLSIRDDDGGNGYTGKETPSNDGGLINIEYILSTVHKYAKNFLFWPGHRTDGGSTVRKVFSAGKQLLQLISNFCIFFRIAKIIAIIIRLIANLLI